ncbi:MAG: ABC transporter permease [Elusimicrobia bacterium]|nr:ABC transporter permease [Elusimicrobiota bacterium]
MVDAFRRVRAITQLTMLEEVRNKVLNATFLFAVVLTYFGLVLTNLAQGFEDRFFRDIAFSMVEFFGLAILLQSAYRVTRQDVRKGSSVEMFFVRPVKRWEYLIGRYFGIALLLWVGMAVMAGVQLGLGAVKKFGFEWIYVAAYIEIYLKLAVVMAAAFLLAMVTTSQASYLISSLLVYASGHVMHLLRALIQAQENAGLFAVLFIKPLTYLLPNFSLYPTVNNLEAVASKAVAFALTGTVFAAAYTIFYGGILLALSVYLFSRSEVQ